MRRICTVLIAVFATAIQLTAQRLVTPAQLLATAKTDARYRFTLSIADQATNLPTHDGYLNALEARLGINGSALGDTIYGYLRNEDSYGLIISPNSLRELRHQKSLMKAKNALYSLEAQMELEQALQKRYALIAQSHFDQRELATLRSTEQLLTNRQTILRTTAQAGQEVKPKDVIETERDRLRTANQIADLERQLRTSQSIIAQYLQTEETVALDTAGFISLPQIRANLISTSVSSVARPEVTVRKQKLAIETAKLAYENSQNRQILQSVRLGYDRPLYLIRPNRFNTTNNISLRVGLAVPLPSNNRFRKSQAVLDRLEAERSLYVSSEDDKQSCAQIRSEIIELDRFYTKCAEQQAQSILPVYLSNQALKAQLSPLEINDLQLIQQSLTSRIVATEREITQLYLAYLLASGAMAQSEVNWLEEGKK
jgi:hypothetical protein